MIPIIGAPTAPIEITDRQMAAFAAFHECLGEGGLKLAIVCPACLEALRGANHPGDHAFSVKCGCREYKAKAINPAKLYNT